MPTVALRGILESEREELRGAAERYWAGLMPHAPVIRDPARRAVYFAERFRFGDPASMLWWAIVDDVKVGFAAVDVGEDHDGPTADVRDFFVEAPWRRRGVGRGFARQMIEELRARGVGCIGLNVRHDNPVALAFWHSVGFELSLYSLRHYLGS